MERLEIKGRRRYLVALLSKLQKSPSKWELLDLDSHTQIELIGEAARQGDLNSIQRLMKAFGFGLTHLHRGHSIVVVALLNGTCPLFQEFLSMEPSPPDLTDKSGVNPMIAAVARGDNPSLLLLMMQKGYSFISDTGRSALVEANELSQEGNCKVLLQAGAPVAGLAVLGPFWIRKVFVAAGWRVDEELMFPRPPTFRCPSLKTICRSTIRKSCQVSEQNLFVQVPKLPLPRPLHLYLLWGFAYFND